MNTGRGTLFERRQSIRVQHALLTSVGFTCDERREVCANCGGTSWRYVFARGRECTRCGGSRVRRNRSNDVVLATMILREHD